MGGNTVTMLDIVIKHKADTMLSLQTTRCTNGLTESFSRRDGTGRDKVFPI